jgi:hypothetical protein
MAEKLKSAQENVQKLQRLDQLQHLFMFIATLTDIHTDIFSFRFHSNDIQRLRATINSPHANIKIAWVKRNKK